VIHAWIADSAGVRPADAAEALAAALEGTAQAWIDLENESYDAVCATLEPADIHPLVLADMVMESNRPKLDDYGRYVYLVMHSARWEEARPTLGELDILLGSNYIVTYHEKPTRSVTATRELLPRRPEVLQRGPAHLLHFMLDVLVDNYLPIVDRIAEEVDDLEDTIFREAPAEAQQKIVRLKRGMAALRRIVGPERDTLLALSRDELRAIPADMRPYVRDVYDRLARVSDLLDSFRDEIATLLELHVALASNQLNNVIKRLTVIATIGLPLTVVTSYYGMNFRLGVYEWKHGELYVLGVLAATALVTWGVLRWKRWN
jgi:magnesium transporter